MAKRGVKVRGRTYQSRKIRVSSGFTEVERDRINEVLRGGATYADAAAEVGMSYSSFNRIKRGDAGLGRLLRERFVESSDYTLTQSAESDRIGWSDDPTTTRKTSAGVGTLERVNHPSLALRPSTADDTFSEIQQIRRDLESGLYPVTWQEFRYEGATIERPTLTKTIRGPDGQDIDISYKLGRGKSDEQRAYIEQQLLDQGIDPDELDEYYDEATGYGGGGEQ